MNTADVVALLAARIRQLDRSELPIPEKSRLTATLADALLRAIGVDVIDKRLEALQGVLLARKERIRLIPPWWAKRAARRQPRKAGQPRCDREGSRISLRS